MSEAIKDRWVGPTWVARELDIDARTARRLIVDAGVYELIRNRVRIKRDDAAQLVEKVRRDAL